MGWSNLGKIVYARTYARKDSGTLENWEQTVERAIQGNVRGHNVPEQEVRDLIQFAKERKGGLAGRGYWFSGSPSHAKIGGVALNNCLAGDTKVVTRDGAKSIKTVAGTTQCVLTTDGRWVEAPFRSFGVQELLKVTIRRCGVDKDIYATPDHGWFIYSKSGQKEYTKQHIKTCNLKPGNRLVYTFGQGIKNLKPSLAGIQSGLVFGDGTATKVSYGAAATLMLCGDKNKELLSLFSGYTYTITDVGIRIGGLPRLWKEKPSLKADKAFLYGWLAGYFAADGCIGKDGQVILSSCSKNNLEFVKDVCYLLGIGTYSIRESERVSNLTNKPSTLYQLCLMATHLTPDFVLLQHHKDRFISKKDISYWNVVSVAKTGKHEEVFCASVAGTHTFVLEDNILSSNCWYLNASDWQHYVIAQDLLMLGGGVGLSVEHKFTSKLPKIKKGVTVEHRGTKDADFIIPDSREGWCELTRRTLESFFVTGRSFTYSTVCLRGYGEAIVGFGGIASGPIPLIEFIRNISAILREREGKHLRPIDAADLMTSIGQMVVAGNVRRSAIIIMGDCWDKEYLKSKRWDLQTLPTHRARANYSVVCEDVEDLHPLFWKTYEMGEPFGIVNRKAIQKYGRMGELMKDTAEGVNPCAEATLENGEPCNLLEIALCNLESEEEFVRVAELCFRAGKRVTLERYHHELCDDVVKRNRRVGVGITGCLSSKLFNPTTLDRVYGKIVDADRVYSAELGVPESIRRTVVKPSGTMGKVLDCNGEEGIHAALAPYIIQRVQFAANDKLIPALRAAGHHIEPLRNFDGSVDPRTLVADFYVAAPEGAPTVEGGWDMWKQLETLKMAQKHWADQAVSVTVYYKTEELPQLKEWLANNLDEVKSISFLKYSGHGFVQAPKEPITKEEYERLSAKIKPLDESLIGNEGDIGSFECESGSCPIK